jgi:hypothetical protein
VTVEILSGLAALDEKFRECCRRYGRLDVAVAWCGDPVKILPHGHLDKFRGQVHVTVGIAFNRTHPDALAQLMRHERTRVRVFRDDCALFHPKVYLFSRGDAYALFVGSSNLTFAGFYDNIEINTYIEGTFSSSRPIRVAELRALLSEWRTDAYSFVPSERWLNRYRSRYAITVKKARRIGLKTETQVEEEIADASWLSQADWSVYYGKVLAGLRRYEEQEKGIRRALDGGARLLKLPWKATYFAEIEKRRVINGLGDYAALGHVGASGSFQHLIKNGNARQHATIIRSINAIAAFPQPIPWHRLERALNNLVSLGPTMKVWGRLLCLTRPDLFCTVAAPTLRANLAEVLEIPRARFAEVDGYIKLVQLLHASPWFQAPAPHSARAKYIWGRRVAFMDAIFY